VTAKTSEIDTVVGLEVGADGYVSKPYRLRELMLEYRGKGADRRLVTGHHGDPSPDVARGKVKTNAVVDDLAPDQREPHPLRAVQGHPTRRS
jgi:two-component system response regulator RegX3